MAKEVRILITGGGTAGHVSPALAVVTTLRNISEGTDWSPTFRYIGSNTGIEKSMARDANIEFVGVQSGKLRRSTRLIGLLSRQNLFDLFRIPVGIVQSIIETAKFRPNVVFATGGYVSIPPVIAARILGVSSLLHEQTVQIGLANRIASRIATKIALSFPESAEELPLQLRRKTFITGNPVRTQNFDGIRSRGLQHCGFIEKDDLLPVIYVTGGSLGARSINAAIESVIVSLLNMCRVIHQCGNQPGSAISEDERLSEMARNLPVDLQHRYFVTSFVKDEIGDIYAAADLVVGRSGAGTIAEVCALGKPALFIPLVPTGGDEQNRNAKRLASIGAATILPSAQLDGPKLLQEITQLLSDIPRLQKMGDAAKTLARPDASKELAAAILEMAAGA